MLHDETIASCNTVGFVKLFQKSFTKSMRTASYSCNGAKCFSCHVTRCNRIVKSPRTIFAKTIHRVTAPLAISSLDPWTSYAHARRNQTLILSGMRVRHPRVWVRDCAFGHQDPCSACAPRTTHFEHKCSQPTSPYTTVTSQRTLVISCSWGRILGIFCTAKNPLVNMRLAWGNSRNTDSGILFWYFPLAAYLVEELHSCAMKDVLCVVDLSTSEGKLSVDEWTANGVRLSSFTHLLGHFACKNEKLGNEQVRIRQYHHVSSDIYRQPNGLQNLAALILI